MSYTEDSRQRRANKFRISMDVGMGLFYMIIGFILIYARSFGRMTDIPPFVAYLLGGMMMVGGGFRLYRGIRAIWPAKEQENRGQE